jgi:transcriptional regulator with XRE-family HTH domain
MLDPRVNDGIPGFPYPIQVETMGDRIKFLRSARGLTQAELGKIVGVTKGGVSHWENGVTADIKLATFLKLLEALNTDFEYLLFGSARSPSPPPEGGMKSVRKV